MIELTNEVFEEEIKNNLVLVDFYATWCGPCKMMHPVIDELNDKFQNIKIIKVDVDKHEELARKYAVMSIPTLLLIKDGNVIEKNVGYTPIDTLEKWINNNN